MSVGNGYATEHSVKEEFYKSEVQLLANEVMSLFWCAIYIRSKDNFPALFADLAHPAQNPNESHLELSGVRGVDQALANALLSALNLKQINQLRQIGSLDRQKRLKLRKPDEVVQAVKKCLDQLPKERQAVIYEKCVRMLDYAGCIKTYRFAPVGSSFIKRGNSYYMDDLINQSPIMKKESCDKQFRELANFRNTYTGHPNGNTCLQLVYDSGLFQQEIATPIENGIKMFRRYQNDEINKHVERLEKKLNETKKMRKYPPIAVAEFEKEQELAEGEFWQIADAVALEAKWRDNYSQEDDAFYFLEKQRLINCIQRAKINEEVLSKEKFAPQQQVFAPMVAVQPAQPAAAQQTPQDAAVQKIQPRHMLPHTMSSAALGVLSEAQVCELSEIAIWLVDASTLLSERGRRMVGDKLCPWVGKQGKAVYVEWSTLLYLYQLNKQPEHPLYQYAHKALLMLRHFSDCKYVRFVGSVQSDDDPSAAILKLIKNSEGQLFALVSEDISLIDAITEQGQIVPEEDGDYPLEAAYDNVLCFNAFSSTAISLRSESRELQSVMLRASAAPAFVALAVDTVAPTSTFAPTPAAVATAPIPAAAPAPAVPVAPQVAAQQAEEPVRRIRFDATASVPTQGAVLYNEKGEKFVLRGILGEPGGEGTVYETTQAGVAAKIYHANKRDLERFGKIKKMIQTPVHNAAICWPTQLLCDENNRFVGYLMPQAPKGTVELGCSVLKIAGTAIRQGSLSKWTRASLVHVAIAIARTFGQLHRAQVLMGDVNPRNVLILPSNPDVVYFVDCDSYQVGGYNCPVGVPLYSSPDYLKRLKDMSGGYANCPRKSADEEFAIATLLFSVLMLGQAPFAAKNKEQQGDLDMEYTFAYRTKENSGYDTPSGPYQFIWSNTSTDVRNHFSDVFTGKTTYKAGEWASVLGGYQKAIASGSSTDEIAPMRYYDPSGQYYQDYTCECCGNLVNRSKKQAERDISTLSLTRKFSWNYCNNCRNNFYELQNIAVQVECSQCQKKFDSNMQVQMMKDGGIRIICPTCREQRQRYNRR